MLKRSRFLGNSILQYWTVVLLCAAMLVALWRLFPGVLSAWILVLLIPIGVCIGLLIPGSTSPITDAKGRMVPGSIASLEKVRLGGVDQWILIRGVDTAKPLLLYLHGGPGTSMMGLIRSHNTDALEKHFTVVIWDQRGAGKSFAAMKPNSAMNINQFVSDTHELTEMLCRRFSQKKIYLLGHSWGSMLGVLTVQKRPELYHAYVGVGQVVNSNEGERLSYEWTLAQAKKAHDEKSVKKLEGIGAPPYTGDWRSKVVAQRGILGKYGGEVHGSSLGGFPTVIRSLIVSTEYTLLDRINFFRGIFGSMRLLWPQLLPINFLEQAPELKVPVYLLEGRYDYEVPFPLAEQYYQRLVAPRKELIWFENSAHFINSEEKDRFNGVLIDKVLPETYIS